MSKINNIFDVKKKVVVVSGSGRGNGKAIADAFSERGSYVCFIDKEFDIIPKKKKNHLVIKFDLQNTDKIPDLINEILSKFDRVDVLVNNAGVSLCSQTPYDEEILDKTLSVNFKAAYKLCHITCLSMAKNGGGAIINVTSLGAELGFPGNPAYQTSKAALKQLTKALARDWGRHGIRVNNLCPGYIITSMTKNSYMNDSLREERSQRMILGRWGTPDDLIGPCIFLASNASAYITASDIYVDGGWTSKGL
ncbi:MAG: SDR family oxidoreductase [Candidatus Riflebacteria bacterium]|nr:SDR family oxidoreductase [Candidatus Riflebacteria bacterium]